MLGGLAFSGLSVWVAVLLLLLGFRIHVFVRRTFDPCRRYERAFPRETRRERRDDNLHLYVINYIQYIHTYIQYIIYII